MKMTRIARSFVTKYPVTLREIVSTPGIFHQSASLTEDFPYPGMAVIRDLAEFAGYEYGAVRTAVSRIRSAGDAPPRRRLRKEGLFRAQAESRRSFELGGGRATGRMPEAREQEVGP